VPHSVEFVVRSAAFRDALDATRAALVGRGFTIHEQSATGLVAVRGSARLTALLGPLAPRRRHHVRLEVEGTHRPFANSTLALRSSGQGTASPGGSLATKRRREFEQWAVDGIERALIATGTFVTRIDRSEHDR
jgi:hypothetical protein